MKIKLPFTEKFLWDLYNFKNKAEDLLEFITRKRGLPLSDFNLFRDEWNTKNRREHYKKKQKIAFSALVQRLKQSGYLKTMRIKGGCNAVIITAKGMNKLFKIKLKFFDKKFRKDKKWGMVLFDIPENQRKNRDLFRKSLKNLGYQKLQKSIWVCKYDTSNETKELIIRYKLVEFVDFLLVEKIELK